MTRRMGLLSLMLLATACGPESEPAADETSKELPASELKTNVSELASPVIQFREGNGCSQDQVGWYIYNGNWMTMPNSSGSGWVNDEARSMMLYRIPANTFIRVYNSDSGSLGADWAEIKINEYIDQLCIHSFEDAIFNTAFEVHYCRYDGDLDGKVSLARAQPEGYPDSTCNGMWMPF
ncbi:hypothetical protein F0U60_05530 [Archangium minus]|uniref:Lipoprotein n=1 Tax=Archangium minus TaxID=83450 RepID=A0ABY9WIL2_9BACT|nr:hypothetical protein F0U60_05530 [Archangium minus]